MTQHVEIMGGYDYIGLSLASCLFLLGHVRDPVHVVDVQEGLADTDPGRFQFRSEAEFGAAAPVFEFGVILSEIVGVVCPSPVAV